jgi:hypothetical protein
MSALSEMEVRELGAVRCQTRRRVSAIAEPLHPRTRLAARPV